MPADPNTDLQTPLILAKLDSLSTIIATRIEQLDQSLAHHKEIDDMNCKLLSKSISDLKIILDDHESRIRLSQDTVSQFRLLSGGASLTSIFAIIKAFLS